MTEVEVTKVTRKYQITVPKEARDALDISEGDYLAVIANGDELILKKISVPTWEEIFEAGERSAKEKKITREKVLKASRRVRDST